MRRSITTRPLYQAQCPLTKPPMFLNYVQRLHSFLMHNSVSVYWTLGLGQPIYWPTQVSVGLWSNSARPPVDQNKRRSDALSEPRTAMQSGGFQMCRRAQLGTWK